MCIQAARRNRRLKPGGCRMMVSRIAAALLLTGITLSAVDLVKDGVPCADIVISEDPAPGVLAAAQDLQNVVLRMSGAELKIVTPEKSALPGKICVGESACTREAGYKAPEFHGSGYDIWIQGSCVVLTGPVKLHRDPAANGKKQELSVVASLCVPGQITPPAPDPELGLSLSDDLGPMYAVSAFLENLGVRFYTPGPYGTIVPQKNTISVTDGRETKEAAFGIREYQFGVQAETEAFLWLKRLKNGSASSPRIGVLVLADVMREAEKEHPDWIARDKKGELLISSHDLCGFPRYLREDFRNACAEKIRKLFDADPGMKKLIVMPPGSSYQMDADEAAKAWVQGVFPQSPRKVMLFDFVSALARELKKTHPDRQIIWMDPFGDFLPPRETLNSRPDNLTAFPHPRAPHTYAKAGDGPKYLKMLGDLNRTFRPDGMIQREWWNEFEDACSPGQPFWFPKTLQDVRKGQRDNGVTGLLIDLTTISNEVPETPLTHFMIYLNSKLMWDPDLDLDALLSEYCRLWFGPAESEMRCLVYYGADILSRKGIRTVNHSKKSQMRFDDIPVIFQLLDRAKEKTQPGTLYRSRVEELEICFAWLKEAFRKRPSDPGDPILTAQPFPCDRTCSGDLSAYKNWIKVGGDGPNRTEMALGVTDNRERLLVAVRCFDDKMTKQPSAILRPDDLSMIRHPKGLQDVFEVSVRSPLRGDFFLCVGPGGVFIDASTDPETIIQTGSVLGWSDDKTAVKVRRLADHWEAEIHFALGYIGEPWPDEPSNAPWSLYVTRSKRIPAGKTGLLASAQYALNFSNMDSGGNDVHAMRLLPGAKDQYVYGVKRAAGKVPLDAGWDGPEWKDVPELRLGLNWFWYERSTDYFPDARAKLQYDDKYIYVHYLVRDQYVKAEFQKDQTMVCLDSCVEFFTKPRESGPYFNFECNCAGILHLSRISENADRTKSFVPLQKEELEQIKRFHTLQGPILQEIEQPTVWRLVLQIPLELFVKHADVQLPLTGQVWSANFFKCADGTSHPCWLMWKRAKGFHVPEDFGKIIFE